MPSIVLLIENVSEDDLHKTVVQVNKTVPDHWKAWTYSSSSLSDEIAEACFEAHVAERV